MSQPWGSCSICEGNNSTSVHRSIELQKKLLMLIRFKLNLLAIVTLFGVIWPLISLNPQVDAGLIHIYHKYRSKPTEVALRELESSIEGQTINSNQNGSLPIGEEDILGVGSNNNEEHTTTAIEFSSPMKRIMELIGGHPPLIVVSSGSAENSAADSFAGTSSPENLLQQSITTSGQQQPATSGDRQHWTILDPSGHMLATTATSGGETHPQPTGLLATQQQQLYQSTVPFEQYYIATPSSSNNNNNNNQQFAVVPAYAPASGSFQQVAGFPFVQLPFQLGATEQQANQQQQQQQQSQLVQQTSQQLIGQTLEPDKTQPIFLSSYVPEIPLTGAVKQTEENRPDSIQQVQYAQVGETNKPTSKQERKSPEEADAGDESSSDGPSSTGEKNSDQEPAEEETPEEPTKTKRSHMGKNSDIDEGDESPGSGSMSYENKFDSDKDEQPRESVSLNGVDKSKPAETNNYSNGLVSTGLDDTCLQCICRASSGCDSSLRCITRGADEKYCGPFQLTEEYWNMAGSPGDEANSFISFEDCSNNEDCATETVVNYMKKYLKDCDDDGQITCVDYARLHRLKPDECDNTDRLTQKYEDYWTKFQHCAENYNRTRDGDDEHI